MQGGFKPAPGVGAHRIGELLKARLENVTSPPARPAVDLEKLTPVGDVTELRALNPGCPHRGEAVLSELSGVANLGNHSPRGGCSDLTASHLHVRGCEK